MVYLSMRYFLFKKLSQLKNSEPRVIGVSEGARARSTNIGQHHSSSKVNCFLMERRTCYEPTHSIAFSRATHDL
jgi:hypothetical protein